MVALLATCERSLGLVVWRLDRTSAFEPAAGGNNERCWYSPAAKAIVKDEIEVFQARSGGWRQTVDLMYELTSYRVN